MLPICPWVKISFIGTWAITMGHPTEKNWFSFPQHHQLPHLWEKLHDPFLSPYWSIDVLILGQTKECPPLLIPLGENKTTITILSQIWRKLDFYCSVPESCPETAFLVQLKRTNLSSLLRALLRVKSGVLAKQAYRNQWSSKEVQKNLMKTK